MSAHDEIREGIGEAYDALLAEFSPVTTIYLQIENPDPEEEDGSDEYITVFTQEGKWLFEKKQLQPSVYTDVGRKTVKMLNIAVESDEIREATEGHTSTGEEDPIPTHSGATHVLIGDTRYTFIREDRLPPEFTDPQWYLPCNMETT